MPSRSIQRATPEPAAVTVATNIETVAVRQFAFVLLPGFSLLALASAIDVLRAANAQRSASVYAWTLVSADATEVYSSSGLPLRCEPLDAARPARVIALCGGDRSHDYHDSRLLHWLREMATRDVQIGSISDGAFVAATAGLFFQHRSTIHWKCLDAYRVRFPDLDIRASILEIDRRRFSCAGGTASLDLFLHFVFEDFGPECVAAINDNYFHEGVRDSSISQNMADAYRHATASPILAEVLRILHSRIDERLSVAEVAREVGSTHRSVDRLFQRHLQSTPMAYLRKIRLTKAAALLKQTGLPISDIAQACGFSTASHLGKYFRGEYQLTPTQYRQQQRQS